MYFPVDSILPEWVTDTPGLTGKLSGKEKNRVKTIKLRGNISQGIVAFPQIFADKSPAIMDAGIGEDVAALLGVEKYDPPAITSRYGKLRPLPPFVSKYDIESAQNYVGLVEHLMDEPMYITEKLEGSHWSITLLTEEDRVEVNQRNFRIEPIDGKLHDWHKVAQAGNFVEKLQQIAAQYEAAEHNKTVRAVTLRGEIVGPGIQDNYYKLKKHQVYLFEAEINGQPLPASEFLQLVEQYDLPVVPLLAVGVLLRAWLNSKTLKEASDGRSKIGDKAREGIVIKPITEQRDDTMGRLFLKQRGPKYLAKSDF